MYIRHVSRATFDIITSKCRRFIRAAYSGVMASASKMALHLKINSTYPTISPAPRSTIVVLATSFYGDEDNHNGVVALRFALSASCNSFSSACSFSFIDTTVKRLFRLELLLSSVCDLLKLLLLLLLVLVLAVMSVAFASLWTKLSCSLLATGISVGYKALPNSSLWCDEITTGADTLLLYTGGSNNVLVPFNTDTGLCVDSEWIYLLPSWLDNSSF